MPNLKYLHTTTDNQRYLVNVSLSSHDLGWAEHFADVKLAYLEPGDAVLRFYKVTPYELGSSGKACAIRSLNETLMTEVPKRLSEQTVKDLDLLAAIKGEIAINLAIIDSHHRELVHARSRALLKLDSLAMREIDRSKTELQHQVSYYKGVLNCLEHGVVAKDLGLQLSDIHGDPADTLFNPAITPKLVTPAEVKSLTPQTLNILTTYFDVLPYSLDAVKRPYDLITQMDEHSPIVPQHIE